MVTDHTAAHNQLKQIEQKQKSLDRQVQDARVSQRTEAAERDSAADARRGVAEAGSGLPPIEPGMPLPAGTGLTRRRFVSRATGLALAVYGGTKLLSQAYDDGIARAAAAPTDPVLVSIFLDGGADALSILFPGGDPKYRVLRPKLALPASSGIAFSDDPRLRWHASLASLATLHAEGKVTVLPAIGYTSPDQSHFTSRHYWEVGATDPLLRTGWLGRYLDRVGTQDNPLQGLSLFTRLQPSLATTKVPVASIDGPDRYSLTAQKVDGAVAEQMVQTLGPLDLGDFGIQRRRPLVIRKPLRKRRLPTRPDTRQHLMSLR